MSLLPVGNESVLEIQIVNLRASGVEEIILALGHKPELFLAYFGDGSKWGLKIHYSIERQPLGTAGPLTLLREHLDAPFLVVNGDILTDMDYGALWRQHVEEGADLTVTTTSVKLPLEYGVIRHRGRRILDIEEKTSLEAEINAGIYCIDPSVVDRMPVDTFVSMDTLLRQLIADERTVSRYSFDGYWLDIGQMANYEKANEMCALAEAGEGATVLAWRRAGA